MGQDKNNQGSTTQKPQADQAGRDTSSNQNAQRDQQSQQRNSSGGSQDQSRQSYSGKKDM